MENKIRKIVFWVALFQMFGWSILVFVVEHDLGRIAAAILHLSNMMYVAYYLLRKTNGD